MSSDFKYLTTFKHLIHFLWTRGTKIRIILSFILTGVIVAINIAIPLVNKRVIDILSHQNKSLFSFIPIILIAYGLLWISVKIVSQIRTILVFYVLRRGVRSLTICVFDHLNSLSLRFHTNRRTGPLIASFERASLGFDAIFSGIFIFLLPLAVEMITIVILLAFYYGTFYSCSFVLIITCYLLCGLFAMSYVTKKKIEYNKARSETNAYIMDNLVNFETVKHFCNEHYAHNQCDQKLQFQEKAGIARHFSDAMVQLSQGFVIGIGVVCISLASSNAVISGQMNVGDFILINGYLWRFVMPLNQFGYILQQLQTGIEDLSDVMRLLSEKSEIQDCPGAINLMSNTVNVIFDNVVFGYTPQRMILNKIFFTIPAGKTVALVGPTGTGKSTVARLLFRFYDVNSGRILLNGHDVRTITQQSLRALIGVVAQDTVLFNNTLCYNIAYGCPTASKDEIEQAIHFACLDGLLRQLPEGHQTMVGERGFKLSSGERQRVAIARALLKKPALYIFDEATSALDSHTEKQIQHNIEKVATGTTKLIIAHRLSTVVNADEILVFDQGLIIERGTHQFLLNFNGLYAKLWHSQLHQQSDLITNFVGRNYGSNA